MTPIPNQPTPPVEGAYNEIEQLIDAEQPLGLWPHNQNSNYGMVRKVLADHIQSAVDTLSDLYDETFVDTSLGYLGRWERELRLPVGTAFSAAHRRTLAHSRRSISPFTDFRRKDIVERFLLDTLGGTATSITASGIPIVVGGITLFSGAVSLVGLYRIYENVPNFSYSVRIKNSVTPDIAGLLRELTHITPAGISFAVDNTPADVLKWDDAVIDLQPNGWWKLTDYTDSSGYGNNGSVGGAPAAIAAPGLLPGGLAGAATNAAKDFSGAAQYVSIPFSTKLDINRFTVMGIVRPDSLPTGFSERAMWSFGANGSTSWNSIGIANFGVGVNKFYMRVSHPTGTVMLQGTTTPVVGTIYHLEYTFDGKTMRLYVNGIQEASYDVVSQPISTGTRWIGTSDSGSGFWDGGLDEIIFLDYPLPAAKTLEIANTSKAIP